jgi:two-component system alkaline phosphatase synthesis response regulator PhoP
MVLSKSEALKGAPHILIVDDHEQNLELLEAYLEEVHARVSKARDGLEALRLVQLDKPDLILLDVMMPRMSGFQLVQKLRAEEATKGVPVIMVTALGEVSDVARATELGVREYLTKPVNKVDLLARVRAAVGG